MNARDRAINALDEVCGGFAPPSRLEAFLDALTAHISHVLSAAEGKLSAPIGSVWCHGCERWMMLGEKHACGASPAPAPSASSDERRWWFVLGKSGAVMLVCNEPENAHAYKRMQGYAEVVEVVEVRR